MSKKNRNDALCPGDQGHHRRYLSVLKKSAREKMRGSVDGPRVRAPLHLYRQAPQTGRIILDFVLPVVAFEPVSHLSIRESVWVQR